MHVYIYIYIYLYNIKHIPYKHVCTIVIGSINRAIPFLWQRLVGWVGSVGIVSNEALSVNHHESHRDSMFHHFLIELHIYIYIIICTY